MRQLITKFLPVVLIAIAMTAGPCLADLGHLYYNAVCRVEKANGEVIDGVMEVAKGGYGRFHDLHGFLILYDSLKSPSGGKPIRFEEQFYTFLPREDRLERPGGGSGSGRKPQKIYFLKDVTSDRLGDLETLERLTFVDSTAGGLLLRRDEVQHGIYQLHDSVEVFARVPEELYLNNVNSTAPVRIAVSEIVRFELIRLPSKAWLEQIDSVTAGWLNRKIGETDVQGPAWIHDEIRYPNEPRIFIRPWSE